MPRLPLFLIIAGLAAAVFSQLGAVGDLTLFGISGDASGPLGLGPQWAPRVPDVAGGLGLSAALCGAIQWRWPDRTVAGIVAVVLALGTVFVVWWLAAPPAAVFDRAGEPFAYHWSLWVAAGALLAAALGAAALATARR